MKSPPVSVIVPCYNRAKLVGETIENMLRQTLPPNELIVVDDGSTDNSVEVIKSFGQKVQLVQQANQGPGAARNAGFARSTCEFIQFMDSDDLASLNKLEIQSEALASQGADMVYGPWIHVELANQHVTRFNYVLQPAPVPSNLSLCEWHLRGWTPVLQNCLFRRSFLDRLGPLKVDLLGTEDYEFLNRIFLAKPKAAFTPDCMVFYRMHDAGKLSAGGTTTPQKLDHKARAVGYVEMNLCRQTEILKSSTRFVFAWQAWQLWSEMSASGKFLPAKLDDMRRIFEGYPSIYFRAFSFWNRLFSGLRVRLTGNTWANSYRARPAGSREFSLMREAGLLFNSEQSIDPS